MPKRVCTKCGSVLFPNNNYFCGQCGAVLEESIVEKPILIGKKVVFYDAVDRLGKNPFKDKIKIFSKVFPLKYFLIILGVLILFGGYKIFSNSLLLIDTSDKVGENNTCVGDFTCGVFGTDNINMVVPENVDVYLEGFDFNKFSQLFLDYNPTYSVLFEELYNLKSSHFAVFGEYQEGIVHWTLIVVSDENPTSTLISMINNPQGIYIGRIDNFYIISSRNTIMGDIQTAYGGVIKNISHNSTYSLAKEKKSNGSLLLLSSGKNGKNMLYSLIDKTGIPGYAKSILMQFKDEGKNYLVL